MDGEITRLFRYLKSGIRKSIFNKDKQIYNGSLKNLETILLLVTILNKRTQLKSYFPLKLHHICNSLYMNS